jgi:hypothetical protein
MAEDKEWTLARKQEKIKEIQAPVKTLIRLVKALRRDSAVAAWGTQVHTLTDKMVEGAQYSMCLRTRAWISLFDSQVIHYVTWKKE